MVLTENTESTESTESTEITESTECTKKHKEMVIKQKFHQEFFFLPNIFFLPTDNSKIQNMTKLKLKI